MSPGPSPAPASGRGPRNAVVAVALLVLVLVVVLAGLLRGGGEGSAGGGAAVASPSARSATSSAPGRAPTAAKPSPRAGAATRDPESGLRVVALASLPREAQQTVRLIDAGGPFPYAKDGVTFGNRERVLPRHPSGWYREYTVPTPGEGDRGARRIVTGDDDRLLYYTADHYASFVSVTR